MSGAVSRPPDVWLQARQLARRRISAPSLWRTVAVVAAVVCGAVVEGMPATEQRIEVIRFMAFIAASMFASLWPLIAAVELGLAASLWAVVQFRWRSWPARLVVELNRTAGHVEALVPWLLVCLTVSRSATLNLGLAAVVVAWGERIVDAAASLWLTLFGTVEPDEQKHAGRVRRARRVPMYLASVLAWVIVALQAPGQVRALVPCTLAIVLAMVVRLLVTWRDHRREDAGLTNGEWSQLADVTAALVVVAVLGLAARQLGLPNPQAEFKERISEGQCAGRPDGAPTIALFLLGDTQFHELRGDRSAANVPMVDAVVPVAVRPVALDLLSGVTLDHFASMFRSYLEASRGAGTQTSYAFLGDLGDIGCTSEIERYGPHFDRFEPESERSAPHGHLAGIAPGNHDNTFVGNFLWHPDWGRACGDEPVLGRDGQLLRPKLGDRAGKLTSDRLLAGLARRRGLASLDLPPESLQNLSATIEDRGALPMVSKIGVLPGMPSRPVYAVFLDTGDSAWWQYGVAGTQGHISRGQIEFVRARVPADAWVVLVVHHPLAQLGPWARDRVGELADAWQERLLLVVSAHTHRTAWNPEMPLGQQRVAEFTVGSTTDPTQEIGLLEVRGSAQAPRLWLTSIPAVARPAMDCPPPGPIASLPVPVERCEVLLAEAATRCERLLDDDGKQDLPTLQAMTNLQKALAYYLFECVGSGRPGNVLEPETYARIANAGADAHDRLVCLSWASSLLQSHKASAWHYRDAVAGMGDRTVSLGGFAVRVPVRAPPTRP